MDSIETSSTGKGRWITKYSRRGYPYQVWKSIVPWIDPTFLRCCVYLYPSEAAAEDGESLGGSGFLIGIELIPDTEEVLLCVVTNKHVIDNGNMVCRINTKDGGIDIIALDQATWFAHPNGDDIAVCPISLATHHERRYLTELSFLSKELIDRFEIGPGDDVFVVGRFINHEGKQRNLPTVRFGNIAQMPDESLIRADDFPQESFLVEARSISGYSGSPVFVNIPLVPIPPHITPRRLEKLQEEYRVPLLGTSWKRVDMPFPPGPFLLGISYCYLRNDEVVRSYKNRERPVNDDWFVKGNTGMMGVIPAWKVLEIIQSEAMKPVIDMAVQESKKQPNKRRTPVELTDSSNLIAPNSSNPSHKEDFTQLVSAAVKKQPQDH